LEKASRYYSQHRGLTVTDGAQLGPAILEHTVGGPKYRESKELLHPTVKPLVDAPAPSAINHYRQVLL